MAECTWVEAERHQFFMQLSTIERDNVVDNNNNNIFIFLHKHTVSTVLHKLKSTQ